MYFEIYEMCFIDMSIFYAIDCIVVLCWFDVL